MKHFIRFAFLAAVLALLSGITPAKPRAAEVEYTITGLGLLPGSGPLRITGLNDNGQIIGYTYLPGVDSSPELGNGFLWKDDYVFTLRSLGGRFPTPLGINNRGDIVGVSDYRRRFGFKDLDEELKFLPVIWIAGSETPLPLAKKPGLAHGINDHGEIAGTVGCPVKWKPKSLKPIPFSQRPGLISIAINSRGDIIGYRYSGYGVPDQGFVYRNRKLSILETFGGKSGYCVALNNRGEIVGSAQAGDRQWKACIWTDGRPKALEGLHGDPCTLSAINDQGVIVGTGYGKAPNWYACVWRQGEARDLNRLVPAGFGWELTKAEAINNKDQIAGVGMHNGKEEGFLLTPVGISPKGTEAAPSN